MNKKTNSAKKGLSINDIVDLTKKILDELINLDTQIKKTQSKTLKELLTKNYAIGSNIYIRFQDIVNLYKNYIEYTSKHSHQLADMTISSNKKTLENIKNTIKLLEETKFDDIKQFCISTIDHQTHMVKQSTEIIEFNDALNELIQLMTLNIIYLSIYNCYLPFTINDYNRYKIIKESVLNITKTITSLIPFLSEFLSLFDIVNDISNIIRTNDDEYMRNEFFNNTNNDLIKIEKQTAMLSLAYTQQNSLIDCLTKISDNAKKQYDEFCCKSPNE